MPPVPAVTVEVPVQEARAVAIDGASHRGPGRNGFGRAGMMRTHPGRAAIRIGMPWRSVVLLRFAMMLALTMGLAVIRADRLQGRSQPE